MSRAKPPAPHPFAVGDRVTVLITGAPVQITTIAKVLTGGRTVRVAARGIDDYFLWRKSIGEKVYYWEARFSSNELRPWQDGDERAVALRNLRIKRTEADRRSGQAATDAEHYRAEAKRYMGMCGAAGARIEEAVDERRRLDAEIAALEKETGNG